MTVLIALSHCGDDADKYHMLETTTQPMFVRDNALLLLTFPENHEFVPVRRESGRIAWPSRLKFHVGRSTVREAFEANRILGLKYKNDHYVHTLPSASLIEFTAAWRNKMAAYPWLDDVLRITGRQPTRRQLLQLRELLADFELHQNLWSNAPNAEQNNDFADGLLRHVDAILQLKFKQEFRFAYLQPHIIQDSKSASAAKHLFDTINVTLMDENGKRRPVVGLTN